jgi:hypothetical protein
MQHQRRINSEATRSRLKRKWRASGLTQDALARSLKLSQEQCSRLLRGRFQRESEGLRRLCAFFDVSIAYKTERLSLARYPAMRRCLVDILDGTRTREHALVRLLRSARALSYTRVPIRRGARGAKLDEIP